MIEAQLELVTDTAGAWLVRRAGPGTEFWLRKSQCEMADLPEHGLYTFLIPENVAKERGLT